MMKMFFILALFAFGAMSSCAQTDYKKFNNDSEVPRATVEEAKKMFDDGAIFIDVRAADQYKDEHVKGAINIQKTASDAELDKVPKGKKIVIYCS